MDARADVEARDSGGSTAVHRSIYLNYKGYTFDAAAFKVLVTAGANLDARDDEGYTVLDWVLDDCYLTDAVRKIKAVLARRRRAKLALRFTLVVRLLALYRRAVQRVSTKAPPHLTRALSEHYGPGASQYTVKSMHEWLGCWRSAAEASKARDWPAAVALLEESATLRPDFAKGQENLAKMREKMRENLATCQENLARMRGSSAAASRTRSDTAASAAALVEPSGAQRIQVQSCKALLGYSNRPRAFLEKSAVQTSYRWLEQR